MVLIIFFCDLIRNNLVLFYLALSREVLLQTVTMALTTLLPVYLCVHLCAFHSAVRPSGLAQALSVYLCAFNSRRAKHVYPKSVPDLVLENSLRRQIAEIFEFQCRVPA